MERPNKKDYNDLEYILHLESYANYMDSELQKRFTEREVINTLTSETEFDYNKAVEIINYIKFTRK